MRRVILLTTALLGLARPCLAQPTWTGRPLTIVVPYVPGGASDTLARVVGAALTPAIGQPVVVENRPGASAAVAAALVARAAPDGHTMLVAASGIPAINPHLKRGLAYDPVRDVAPLLAAALRTPEVTERLSRIGFAVEATSRADFAVWLARELAEWQEVVRQCATCRPN